MANLGNNNELVFWCNSFNGETVINTEKCYTNQDVTRRLGPSTNAQYQWNSNEYQFGGNEGPLSNETENWYAQPSFTNISNVPVMTPYHQWNSNGYQHSMAAQHPYNSNVYRFDNNGGEQLSYSNGYRFGGNGGPLSNETENWYAQPSFPNISNVPVMTPYHQWNSNGYQHSMAAQHPYNSNVYRFDNNGGEQLSYSNGYRFGGNGGPLSNETENWYAQPSFTNILNVPVMTSYHQWNSNGYQHSMAAQHQYNSNVYRFDDNGGELFDCRLTHVDAPVEKQNSNLVSQFDCGTTNLEKGCEPSDIVSQKKKRSNVAKPVSSGRLPKQIAVMQSPFQLTVKPKQVRGCDNSDMYVETSGVKKQCCPFCDKLYSKLPRHMEEMHVSEPDVQEFLKHPKNSAERKAILDDLRKTGNFNHNRIAKLNKKLYIPSRRPNVNHKREAFQHSFCPYCKGSYSSTALRLHIKYRCPKKPKVNDEKLKGGRVERVTRKLAAAVDGRIHESASIKLEQLLQTKKREDDVVRLIRFDWLLILYGNKLCKKYTRFKNRGMIRTRLRLGGRILIALKSIQPQITDFASLYHPNFYDSVVEAIEIVARHNAEREEFDFPATASKCITGIREIAAMLISKYIKKDNVETHRTAELFMTVFNTEISTDIGKAVTETQVRRKTEKQVIVPSLDDVTILARHIDVKRNEFFDKLSMSFLYNNWIALAEATVGSIIVFNRKRIGDVEDILVGDFKRRESIKESTSDPLYQNLSEEEKKMARQYSRMKVRGKKGHVASVMLKPEFEKSIELLLSHRKNAGIQEKNEFLFALPSSVDEVAVINAYAILKKFALSCGAQDPLHLNGTSLRYHLATHCASLELSDSRVADVAAFMGHRKFYRQNTVERQFVHLPQLLEVSQGNASVVTFPNQMNTKQMIRDTDLEREGPSTSQPKYQSMQKQNVRPQSQQKDNCEKEGNNNIKKTGNKRTSKRQLCGSHYPATRSNMNVDLKQCNEGRAFAENIVVASN